MAVRYLDGVNCFWMSQPDKECPTLSLSVRGDLAYLYYVADDDGAGFHSTGNSVGLPEGDTSFAISLDGDTIEVSNTSLVPLSRAVEAAKEFLSDARLPSSVEWAEL